MIRIAPIGQIHSSMIVWRCVKRLGDFSPIDGAEYLVQKTRNSEPVIYRAANGKLRSTGDTFVRWGITDGPEDIVRVPTHR